MMKKGNDVEIEKAKMAEWQENIETSAREALWDSPMPEDSLDKHTRHIQDVL